MENETEKKIKDKYLPIGTIVKLKDGKKELMILSYFVIPTGEVYDKNGKVELNEFTSFDYGAVLYPEGFISPELIYAFNHENIAEVCHLGYETEASEKFTSILAKKMDAIKNNIKEHKEKNSSDNSSVIQEN